MLLFRKTGRSVSTHIDTHAYILRNIFFLSDGYYYSCDKSSIVKGYDSKKEFIIKDKNQIKTRSSKLNQLIKKEKKENFLCNSVQSSSNLNKFIGWKIDNSKFGNTQKISSANQEAYDSLCRLDLKSYLSICNFSFSLNSEDNFIIKELDESGWSAEYGKVVNKFHKIGKSKNSNGRIYTYLSKNLIAQKLSKMDGKYHISFSDYLSANKNTGKDKLYIETKTSRREKHNNKKNLDYGIIVIDNLTDRAQEMGERLMIATNFRNNTDNDLLGNRIGHEDFGIKEMMMLGCALHFIAYSKFSEEIKINGLPW